MSAGRKERRRGEALEPAQTSGGRGAAPHGAVPHQAVSPLRPGTRPIRWRAHALAALSGVLLAGSMPGSAVPLAWIVMLVPLLFAADDVLTRPGLSWGQRATRLFGACWLMGAVWAAITGGWMINTMHVYGGVTLPMAYFTNIVGHGMLVGVEFFLAFAVPFALALRVAPLAFVLVPVWASAVQAFWPHLFMWSFGQFMWQSPPLIQAADVLGSAGLNLIYLPFQLVLWAALRTAFKRPVLPSRQLLIAGGGALALLALAFVYGQWRSAQVAQAEAAPPQARLIAIQPNFSLKRLASNPELSPSDREQSLGTLLRDSDEAVSKAGPSALPTVVVWPESVFPTAYFRDVRAREAVEAWVRSRGIHLVLASVDVQPDAMTEEGRRIYGIAVHVAPDGSPPRVYRKIVLMPWGEFIPFADWFPWYRRLLLAWIPQISEFTPGGEYTVFPLGEGVRLAPMICYDATQAPIAQGMAASGANVALVLANLAWFGPTTASRQFEQVIRFRAIENRMPVLFASQSGRTVYFNARGEPASEILPVFGTGVLTVEVAPVNIQAVFTRWGRTIEWGYLVLAVGLAGVVGWRRWKK